MKQSEIKELSTADLNEKLGAMQKNYTDPANPYYRLL